MPNNPPPGSKPALMIAIGPKPDKMPPPDSDENEPGDDDQPTSGKASREDALVITADKSCGHCEHFQGDSCEKVEGSFSPDDRCLRYFEASGGDESADDDFHPEQPQHDRPTPPPV